MIKLPHRLTAALVLVLAGCAAPFGISAVQPGMRADDVVARMGAPARVDRVASWDGPVLTYRWRDIQNADMFYWVYLDPQGIVRRAHPGMEVRDRLFNFR